MQLGDIMKINFKSKRGFTTVDLTIATIVILIFVVIMTSISYNVYLSSIEAKRTAVALNYVVDIFEHIGAIDFSEVTASYELLEIDSLEGLVYKDISSNNGIETITGTIGTYDIEIKIEDYRKEGVIKIVTLTIDYPVSRKNTETVEFKRLKTVNNS